MSKENNLRLLASLLQYSEGLGWKKGASTSPSVVDDCGISFEYFFGLPIKLVGNLMDLIFLPTNGTAHPYLSAASLYLEFTLAFLTLHFVYPIN